MDLTQQLFEDNHVNDVVNDAIDVVFQEFLGVLADKELEALAIPFATDLAMEKIYNITRLATYAYDGDVKPNEAFEKMEADAEPYPSCIDSWARGTVSTRKVVNDPNAFRRGVPSSHSNTPSVSSYRSSATGRSRNTSSNRSYRSTNSKHTTDDKTGKVFDLENEFEGEVGGFGATGYLFDMLQKAKKKKSQAYYEQKEGVKGEFDMLSEQLAKATKDMKGKKFVLDRYGNPVALGKVDPGSLPPFTAALNLNIKSAQDHHEHDGHDKKHKKQFVRVAGSRSVDQSSFQPTLSLATTLSGVDSIPKLNAGITVRSKTSVRAGDALEEDPKHISMKSYMSRSLSAGKSTGSLNDASMFGGSRGISPSRTSNLGGASMSSGLNQRSIDSIPDLDPMEGSRKVPNGNQPYDLSDHDLGLGPALSAGSPPKANLPKKPNAHQKQIIEQLRASPDKGKPRDREFPQNAKAVTDRKHLPAPPLGQIAGHGLATTSHMSMSLESNSGTEMWHKSRK